MVPKIVYVLLWTSVIAFVVVWVALFLDMIEVSAWAALVSYLSCLAVIEVLWKTRRG